MRIFDPFCEASRKEDPSQNLKFPLEGNGEVCTISSFFFFSLYLVIWIREPPKSYFHIFMFFIFLSRFICGAN